MFLSGADAGPAAEMPGGRTCGPPPLIWLTMGLDRFGLQEMISGLGFNGGGCSNVASWSLESLQRH